MGLSIHGENMPYEYRTGYIQFHNFRSELADVFDSAVGTLYGKWITQGLDDAEFEVFKSITPEGLMIFLEHSDCDGELTSDECEKIYNVLENVRMDMMGHNTGQDEMFNVLERWKEMLRWSAKSGEKLVFC